MENTKTTDIALASYLKVKGFNVVGVESAGRMVCFLFNPEVNEIAARWNFNPDETMKTVKNFVLEREQLFRLVKESRDKYENYK